MRDPARIPRVIEALRAYWLANPDMRLCQIIGNALDDMNPRKFGDEPEMSGRGYNTEDEDLMLYVLLRHGGNNL